MCARIIVSHIPPSALFLASFWRLPMALWGAVYRCPRGRQGPVAASNAYCERRAALRYPAARACSSRGGPPADTVSGQAARRTLACLPSCMRLAVSVTGARHGRQRRRASVGGWDALPPQGCRLTFAARPTQCRQSLPLRRLDATVTAAPTGVFLPRKGCPHRAPWSRGVGEQSQRQRHNACLHVPTPGVAAWIAERKVSEEKARHATVFDDIQRRPNDHRRNAVGFKVAGNQTHGLVADRSYGAQYRAVGSILAQTQENFRSILCCRLALAVFGGHAVKAVRQPAECPL